MKLLHTADLHIGKIVHGYSMIEEQQYILKQIIKIAKEEKVAMLIIAGDIYDRAVPSTEAVTVLDEFLTELIKNKIVVCAIAGNHDSGERLNFAHQLLEEKGLILAGTAAETVKQVDLKDEFGKIHLFLLPFIKPAAIQNLYQIPEEKSYQEMLKEVLRQMDYNIEERNILAAHLFVTNNGIIPEQSESEIHLQVGGTENVESYLLRDFDYTALGHIHKAQKIGEGAIYYAGSPLKYSFSEVHHEKSVNIVELSEKGTISVKKRALTPIHDMRRIKGEISKLISREIVSLADSEDYLSVTLTDKEEIVDAIGTLRRVYPNIMQVLFEKRETIEGALKKQKIELKGKTDLEILEEFYQYVREEMPDEERKKVMEWAVKQAAEGKNLS